MFGGPVRIVTVDRHPAKVAIESRPAGQPTAYSGGMADVDFHSDVQRDQLISAIEDLTRRLGRAPNASELAYDLGKDRDEVIEMLVRGRSSGAAGKSERSGGDHSLTLEYVDDLEKELATVTNIDRLPSYLDVLSAQERTVVLLRLSRSLTQSQIAARIGISPAAVSRILARSLTVLREQL